MPWNSCLFFFPHFPQMILQYRRLSIILKEFVFFTTKTKSWMTKILPLILDKYLTYSLADQRGERVPRAPGPISFIFIHFSAKILPNNRFLPKLRGWHSLCLGNPGPASDIHFYRPHTGGGCLPQCMLGYHTHPLPRSRHPPPEQTPSQEQTPPQQTHHTLEQTPPGSRHPLGADTPRSRHIPQSRHSPEETPPRADTPPSRHPSERRPLLRTVRILLECILVFSTCNKAKLHIMIRGKVPLWLIDESNWDISEVHQIFHIVNSKVIFVLHCDMFVTCWIFNL